jgi:osmotically-inducible protein OsmY
MKTDAQLQQDVMAELQWDPCVQAEHIGVEAKDGVVTLAGQVSSYLEKWNAEKATQRVNGARAVVVDIEVVLASLGQRSDADIACSVENALEWTTPLTQDAVRILVEKGWITLSGEVDWQYQREDAASAVRHLVGVTGVSNQIGIKPKVALAAVQQDIEAALARQAHQDAAKIHVHVKGSDVTLSGTVANWNERQAALRAAWNTQGVRAVADQLSWSS